MVPSRRAVSPLTLGMEQGNDNPRKRRSEKAPRSWPGQARTDGPQLCRSWPPHQATSFLGAGLPSRYMQELTLVEEAYPGAQCWQVSDGMWLRAESALLPGLSWKAVFLVGLRLAQQPSVRSWGFWGGSTTGFDWIGPRHTNFPDGSICAFEPNDGTWVLGDSIVELLDLYTLWAVRHLSLLVFERWPGHQSVHDPYERTLELRGDEYCGCANANKLYKDCCQNNDRSKRSLSSALAFTWKTGGGLRKPPGSVSRFSHGNVSPPDFAELSM